MEVTVRHAGSGRSCVVGVSDTDTVLDLKTRAVGEIFAGRRIDAGRAAGGLAARIGTAEGDELDDTQHVADTRLEAGDDVQLLQRWADVKAPAEYSVTDCGSTLGRQGFADFYSLGLSPCGRLCCVCTSSGHIVVFDTTTAEQVAQVAIAYHPFLFCVAFSRCGGWIAAASETKTVTVWCTSTWECVHTLEGHTDRVIRVVWTHCGRLLSGSFDHTVRVWDVEDGVCTAVLDGYADFANGLAVSHTSIFSGSTDNIRVWDVDTLSHTDTLTGHRDAVCALALTTDEKLLVSCSNDKTVKVWRTNTLQCLRTLPQAPESLFALAVSQECDFIVTITAFGSLSLFRLSTGQLIELPSFGKVRHAATSPCGRWLFVVRDSRVCVHHASTLLKQHIS